MVENPDKEQCYLWTRTFNYIDTFLILCLAEPEIDESVICLDWFNSDLSMRIDKNTMMIGEPFHKDGWGYVWSGAKATHGFNSGSVW